MFKEKNELVRIMSAEGKKNVSRACDSQAQHSKGVKYFYVSLLLFIVSIFLILGESILGISGVESDLMWDILAIIGYILSFGFWLFLAIGLWVYFKCGISMKE